MAHGISSDKQVNQLFGLVSSNMQWMFEYSEADAWASIEEYYQLFTDKSYCNSQGIGVQDDDFFFHEAPMGMAMRIHYCLKLKGDPNSYAFLLWRKELMARLKEEQRGGAD